jgi:clan AA aspartic protease
MAYVEGRVNEYLEARVTMRLIATGRVVECLVDTGFSGALVLPAHLVAELGLPIIGHERNLLMVGGKPTSADLALAQVEWLGEVRSVVVIVEDEYLVGTQLLEDARLVIDYRQRTLTVSLEEQVA